MINVYAVAHLCGDGLAQIKFNEGPEGSFEAGNLEPYWTLRLGNVTVFLNSYQVEQLAKAAGALHCGIVVRHAVERDADNTEQASFVQAEGC